MLYVAHEAFNCTAKIRKESDMYKHFIINKMTTFAPGL